MKKEYDYSHIANYKEIKKLQSVLLEILVAVDKFCKDHEISYSLCGGCMIGAIRHEGFIPWDDDIDIIMKRDDYNKFIELWENNPPNGFIMQNKEINAPNLDVSFTKIRKDHTTFLQVESDRGQHHVGIFIDVFPFDRLPKRKIDRLLFYWRCVRYQIYIREHVPVNSSAIIKMITKAFLLFSNKESRRKKRKALLHKIIKNTDDSCQLIAIETMKSLKISYSPDLMDELIPIRFEGKVFMCFKNWKEYLEKFYGDYMTLPPLSQQNWYHRPIVLDFEHNLEEITDETEGTVRFQNQ